MTLEQRAEEAKNMEQLLFEMDVQEHPEKYGLA